MKKVAFYFILLLNYSFEIHSQAEKKAEGFSRIPLKANITPEQCKQEAINQAKVDALQKIFGEVVMEGNTLYTVNKNTNTKTEFNQVFNSISNIYVSGEWIKDLETPTVTVKVEGESVFYEARVFGLVRELKSTVNSFKAKTLSCSELNCETTVFNENQQMFFYFKSSVSGYLSVYLDVPSESKTYCIFPYESERAKGSKFLKGDNDYVFFSKDKQDKDDKSKVDELVFSLTEPGTMETNQLFVLFSEKDAIGKPILDDGAKTEVQKKIKEENYGLPPYLSSSDFKKWLQEVRARNKDLQMSTSYIQIKPQ